MTKILGFLAVLAACGDNAVGDEAATLRSGAARLDLASDGTSLTLSRGGKTLLVFSAGAFQVGTVDDLTSGDSFDPYWLLVANPPTPPVGLAWHAAQRLELASVSTSELAIDLPSGGGVTGHLVIKHGGSGAFAATFTATVSGSAQTAYFRIAPDAGATEGFYGLGEWADAVDHRGKLRPMQMELDPTSEGSDDEDHVPVPLLIGTNGWGVFVESTRPGVFDVARASATAVDVTFGTGADSEAGLGFHLFTADAPLDVLAEYFDVTGYPGLPAPWALGPLIWRDENTDQAQVIDDITQIRSRHLATSGVWFDRPYSTGVETFDWSATKFPAPAAMLQALHDAGLRYGIWQAPYTAPSTNSDPAQANLDYATAHGFFPPVTAVLLNGWGKPLDLSNTEAYAWWQTSMKQYTDPLGGGGWGVEGFKLDYAEDVVVGAFGARTPWHFADGSDEGTMHYDYQLLYHQLHRDLLAPSGGFLLCRTGRWGDQTKGMIIWPGDLDASFAREGDAIAGQNTKAVGGLPAALTKGIGLSASGFPFYASDTGGYRHSPPNKEVWVRWTEANAIMPAMQIGDSSSQTPWEFTTDNGRDQQALDIYKAYTTLHLRLYPYVWSYAQQMATTGRPIVRPVGLAYPELGAHPADEYLLGDDLFVAPVVEAGAVARSLLMPPGQWQEWFYGNPQQGGSFSAPAALDTLPLFVRAGGIIPMLRPTIETLAPVPSASPIESFANDPGVLWVRVAPAAARTSFTVYDGTVLAQRAGEVAYAPGSVFAQGAMFEVIATTVAPTSVTTATGPLAQRASLAALDAATDGWFWETATSGTLWIKVAGAATITFQ